MNNKDHIIDRVFFEVNTRKMETAQTVKNTVDEFLRNDLFPRLALLFDAYNLNDTIFRFNEININISVNNSHNFEQVKYEIAKQFEEKIKVKIEPFLQEHSDYTEKLFDPANVSADDKTGQQKISRIKNQKLTFLYFLANGYLPWYGKEEQINEISSFKNWVESIKDPDFVEEIRIVLLRENAAIDRFINQFQANNIVVLLTKINLETGIFQQQILQWIYENELRLNQLFLKWLIQISLDFNMESIVNCTRILFQEIAKNIKLVDEVSATKNHRQFVILLRKILPKKIKTDKYFTKNFKILSVDNPTEKEIKESFPMSASSFQKEIPEETVIDEIHSEQDKTELLFFEKETNEIAVQNAGIIIVHPFLKHFFVQSGIADKTGKLIKGKLDLAVQSIHFMATGNENVFEGNLVLEKFICGVPLKRSVKKQSLLSDEVREEVEVMLKEIIRNWPALKNSSINDLRQMFFQRDGKLIPMENKYKLLVERKAQDILLEKISWNISLVKLPWIKEIIVVEW